MPKSTKPTCQITVSLYSGLREPLRTDANILITLLNGYQKQVHREFHKASRIVFKKLPFHNNFGDSYTVVAWAEGFRQVGFTPVKVTPDQPGKIDLMLVRNNPEYNFHEARWETLLRDPAYARVLTAGAGDPPDKDTAARRYTDLLEQRPAALACFLNIFTALREIHLPEGTPVDYLQELIWDQMDQDRFFAWADTRLLGQVERAAAKGAFEPRPDALPFHPGATRSYKQAQFGEANVQITFHENDRHPCQPFIKVELDIDYYRDPGAHILLEVLPNALTGSKTDPAQVYVLRWMAARHAGVADFEPPYRVV